MAVTPRCCATVNTILRNQVCQRILMDLLQKSHAERIERGEGAAGATPRQLGQSISICVHQRTSIYICVKTFFCDAANK
jgi:hypothetical protein